MRMAASRGLPLKRVRKRGLQMIKQGMQFTILTVSLAGLSPTALSATNRVVPEDAGNE
jgi:hypothetical protein